MSLAYILIGVGKCTQAVWLEWMSNRPDAGTMSLGSIYGLQARRLLRCVSGVGKRALLVPWVRCLILFGSARFDLEPGLSNCGVLMVCRTTQGNNYWPNRRDAESWTGLMFAWDKCVVPKE